MRRTGGVGWLLPFALSIVLVPAELLAQSQPPAQLLVRWRIDGAWLGEGTMPGPCGLRLTASSLSPPT